jgi:hypothetical protein
MHHELQPRHRPGSTEHFLFPPEMVATVLVGGGQPVDRTDFEHS